MPASWQDKPLTERSRSQETSHLFASAPLSERLDSVQRTNYPALNE